MYPLSPFVLSPPLLSPPLLFAHLHSRPPPSPHVICALTPVLDPQFGSLEEEQKPHRETKIEKTREERASSRERVCLLSLFPQFAGSGERVCPLSSFLLSPPVLSPPLLFAHLHSRPPPSPTMHAAKQHTMQCTSHTKHKTQNNTMQLDMHHKTSQHYKKSNKGQTNTSYSISCSCSCSYTCHILSCSFTLLLLSSCKLDQILDSMIWSECTNTYMCMHANVHMLT